MTDPRKVDSLGRLAVIILVAACGTLVYLQAVQPWRTARQSLGSFREAVRILAGAEGSVDRLNAEIQMVTRQIAKSEALLPADLDLDTFLQELGDIAAQTEVHVEKFTPHEVVPHRLFRELPLQVRLSGSFLAIHAFLDRLERGSRLSRVDRLTIDWNDSRKTCEAGLRLALFFAAERKG